MFCPNCGLQQADATNYCLRCGADLTKKRDRYDEIAGSVSPSLIRQVPDIPEDDLGEDSLEQMDSIQQAGPAAVPGQAIPGAQVLQITQVSGRIPLHYLGLRRLCCFPTFLACLICGIICWLANYEELLECMRKLQEPSFGWETLAAVSVLVLLGLIQALIGMGTIYSRQALCTAFAMSAACAIVGLNYTPGIWKTRLMVFGIFALCAIVEAAAVIGPMEKKKAKNGRRAATRSRQPARGTARGTRQGTSPRGGSPGRRIQSKS